MTTLIFDFDGTIVNSLTSALQIFNALAPQYHMPEVTPEQLEQLRHMEYHTFLKLVKYSSVKLPFIIRKVRKQLKNQIGLLKPIPGIATVLQELHNRHYNLGILTSNSQNNVKLFIEKNNLNYFNFIYSEDHLFRKARKLKRIIRKYHIQKSETFYIGDETRDIIAAKHAGIHVIAVGWGFNDKEILRKYEPNFLIEKPDELLEINFNSK